MYMNVSFDIYLHLCCVLEHYVGLSDMTRSSRRCLAPAATQSAPRAVAV